MHLDINGTGGAFMTSLWQLKRFKARISLFKSFDCPLALAAASMNQRFTWYPPVINHNLGWCNYLSLPLIPASGTTLLNWWHHDMDAALSTLPVFVRNIGQAPVDSQCYSIDRKMSIQLYVSLCFHFYVATDKDKFQVRWHFMYW